MGVRWGLGIPKCTRDTNYFLGKFSCMDKSDDDLSEFVYAGKLKTQTFKQLQLERLIKSGAVIPASKLKPKS